VGDIRVHGLHVEQKKNGILLALSKSTKERKDGCFGAVFMDIQKGRAYFGRKIGGRLTRNLTMHILCQLFMAILN
jgi:hypothetical protein